MRKLLKDIKKIAIGLGFFGAIAGFIIGLLYLGWLLTPAFPFTFFLVVIGLAMAWMLGDTFLGYK